jgi:hypothetical protein
MPVTLDSLIGNTQLNQDVELSTAIAALKNDPAKLQAFLQEQQDKVYRKIMKQKEGTFEKVYGDLSSAAHVQDAVLMHHKRTQELTAVQKEIYEKQKEHADAVVEDKQLAGRKSEMNEWTVNNKRDTLFVMSSLFIMLSGLLLLTGLYRMGLLGSTMWIALGIPLLVVFILIVVNRSQYTDRLRNKRYWNKQIFEGKYGTIPLPSCPDFMMPQSPSAATSPATTSPATTSSATGASTQ